MPLYKVIPTTPCLEKLAHEAAPLLEDKTGVPNKDKRMKLFEYRWTKECNNLVREFFKIKADDVQHALATCARATILKRRPGEERPLPMLLLLENGWVTVSPNQAVVLISIQISRNTLKSFADPGIIPTPLLLEGKLQVRNDVRRNREDSHYSETEWLPGSMVLLFESVSFRMEPAEIPFLMIPSPTSPLEGEGEQAEN